MIETIDTVEGAPETLSLTFEDVAPAEFQNGSGFVLQRNGDSDGLLLSYSEISGGVVDDSLLFSITREDDAGGLENLMSIENSATPKAKFYNTSLSANTIQTNAEALGDGSLAVGSYDSSGASSSSSGFASTSSSDFAALPLATKAEGEASFAQGDGAVAEGQASTALGLLTKTSGHYAFSQGISSRALGLYSVALNDQTEASGQAALSAGRLTKAVGNNSTALGLRTSATGNASMAGGRDSEASGDFSIAIGDHSAASGTHSISVGAGKSSGYGSIALGGAFNELENVTDPSYSPYPEASGRYSFATGAEAKAVGNYSIAMGRLAEANGKSSTAIARFGEANGQSSVAIGSVAKANGSSSVAIGSRATANGESSLAIGGSATFGRHTSALGRSEVHGYQSFGSGEDIISRGPFNFTVGHYNEDYILAGSQAEASDIVRSIQAYNQLTSESRIFAIGTGSDSEWVNGLGRADSFYVTWQSGTHVRQGLTIERYETDEFDSYVLGTDANGNASAEIETVLDIGTKIELGTNFSQVLVRNPTTKKLEYVDGGDITGSTGPDEVTPAGIDRSVQFNDAASLGGDSGFLYNGTDIKLANNNSSVVLTASDGTQYRISVDTDGTIISESVV